MTAIYVVLSFEILAILVLLPLSVSVETRFSLNRKLCVVAVKICGLKVLKIKVYEENGVFRILKNNKEVKIGEKGESRIDLPKILAFLRVNEVVEKVVIICFIGGENAFSAGMNCGALSSFICALFPSSTTSFLYPDFSNERCDFEMRVNAKISVFQILQFVF